MKRIHYYISFIALLALVLPSCIAEDLSNCPDLKIKLIPDTVLTKEELKNAMLYIFNGAGEFVWSESVDPNPDRGAQNLKQDLPSGDYTFVVWYNVGVDDKDVTPYKVKPDVFVPVDTVNKNNPTLKRTAEFYLPLPANDSIESLKLLPTFYGSVDYTIRKDTINDVDIDVFIQTNDINVTLLGLRGDEVNDDYEFVIKDRNARYSFDDAFLDSKNFYYTSKNVPAGGKEEVSTKLRVLKLSQELGAPNPELTIANEAGRIILGMPDNTNLIPIIIESYRMAHNGETPDLTKMHSFDVRVDLRGAKGASITVNDWGDVPLDDITLDL
ncbi:MAG: FimB/Mfa2 family fimbrial subunit [Candidatus Symbiothrix sp.]|nr:FimB/Mfa2 family fimbrial subunit [Candidatus Symbiothrix sp.]